MPNPRQRISLRRLAVALATALFASSPMATLAATENADLLISGGAVYDGRTATPAQRDVVIRGDRIVHVGVDAASRFTARRVIDAGGKIVAPGFIDPHTHPDTYIRSPDREQRRNAPWLFQGVTTIAIGVDGGGSPEVAQQREWFNQHGVGTNLVPYVGFGPVRAAILGQEARAPTSDELAAMRQLTAKAMCEGAFGFSTGLFYAPQSFASREEVVAVAREAALRGGLYDTHQRDESSYGMGLIESTREALDIGRQASMPVHFAHLKALGIDVQGKAAELIALIEAAQAQGMTVTADQYPWLASGTGIDAALLPRWAVDGGDPALLERLADASSLAPIRTEMHDNLRRRGGAEALLLTSAEQPWTGKTLQEMATQWQLEPIDAALRIIKSAARSPDSRSGRVASFNMIDEDVKLLMQQPWMVTSSDGSDGHPRQYASFPRKYARYVKDQRTIGLGDFINRSTSRTADLLGIADRGELKAGKYADVVVFDPERFGPKADYTHPRLLSEGVVTLLINGQLAIDEGQATDRLPGRVLQHAPTAGTCP